MAAGEGVLIEGYASLFGVADLAGDVVRAGAFAQSLARQPRPPMLFQHAAGRLAGRWLMVREDGRGLWVRGWIEAGQAAGRAALDLVRRGRLSGLSIGFRPAAWTPRTMGGRDLKQVELVEISLVASPLLPGARFAPAGPIGSELRAA